VSKKVILTSGMGNVCVKMVKEIAEEIIAEVDKTLVGMYNHRKIKEGLISCKNALITDLRRNNQVWLKKMIQKEKKYDDPKKDNFWIKPINSSQEVEKDGCNIRVNNNKR
jgi:hypothetical protein